MPPTPALRVSSRNTLHDIFQSDGVNEVYRGQRTADRPSSFVLMEVLQYMSNLEEFEAAHIRV